MDYKRIWQSGRNNFTRIFPVIPVPRIAVFFCREGSGKSFFLIIPRTLIVRTALPAEHSSWWIFILRAWISSWIFVWFLGDFLPFKRRTENPQRNSQQNSQQERGAGVIWVLQAQKHEFSRPLGPVGLWCREPAKTLRAPQNLKIAQKWPQKWFSGPPPNDSKVTREATFWPEEWLKSDFFVSKSHFLGHFWVILGQTRKPLLGSLLSSFIFF